MQNKDKFFTLAVQFLLVSLATNRKFGLNIFH